MLVWFQQGRKGYAQPASFLLRWQMHINFRDWTSREWCSQDVDKELVACAGAAKKALISVSDKTGLVDLAKVSVTKHFILDSNHCFLLI
jgi:hypothetical protein